MITGCSHIEKPKTSNSPADANDKSQINNESVQEKNNVTKPKNKLDLSNQNLTKIPDNTFTKTNLEVLNVSGNQLTGAIQAEIRHLQALRVLNASNNKMTGVPAEIGQLKNLHTLDLSNNQLTGLPHELGNLKNLKVLNVSGNNYSTFDLNIIVEGLAPDVAIITDSNDPSKSEEVDVFKNATTLILNDVSGGNANGEAWIIINDNKTFHKVIAKNLPKLKNNNFYEGWLVKRPAALGFFSTGKMIYNENDDTWVLNYETDGDKSNYPKIVITLEPNDGDPAPAKHIIEN